MRVGWIIDGSLDRRTGGTIYDRLIIEGLRRRGVVIEVRTAPPQDAQRLLRELARSQVDVIVGDELSFAALDIIFEHATFARRVLLVHHLTCWEEEISERARARARRLEARLLRRADRIISTSNTTRTRLIAEGARAPIHVVHPGADRLARTARQNEHDDVELLFVGAVTARKRVIELIEAFATTSPPVRLTIVGSRKREPHYVGRVDELIRAHQLENRVMWMGEIDDRELALTLARAAVLVVPSSLEGYGMAATEALHAGAPVIAARATALVEALEAFPDAVVHFDSHVSLADAIQRVTRDPTLLARLKAAAQRSSSAVPKWVDAVASFQRCLAD